MECFQKSFCLQAHTLVASPPLSAHHLGPQGCPWGLDHGLGRILKTRPNPRGCKEEAVTPAWSSVLSAVGALAWALLSLPMEKGPRDGDGHQRQRYTRGLDRAVAYNRRHSERNKDSLVRTPNLSSSRWPGTNVLGHLPSGK